MVTPVTPGLSLVFRIELVAEPGLEVGGDDGRRIFPLTGGRVTGPRLSGTVLPGADWQQVGRTGTARLSARYVIRAEDGGLIAVTNSGIRRVPAPILKRMMAGEEIDPTLYYFRTVPVFEATGAHAWLAEHVFLASGARTNDKVLLDVFKIE